ncbi:MAG TPA: ROK family protein [Candidatus Paceibacterota bacterium]|nr:ROK family protein [Candidatus Paceibacterota bacterium]
MTKSTKRLLLGLDLGGSSIKIAVIAVGVDGKPTVLAQESRDTHPSRALSKVLDDLLLITNEFREKYGACDSIGVGLPGIHDEISGVTSHLTNFSAEWEGSQFRSKLSNRLGRPITVANDGRAFSLAESVLGAGAGFETVVCVVLGTGIGGGVVIDGKLWKGRSSVGELGHQSVQFDGPLCGCGNRGCVELFAGAAAITEAGGRETVREVFEAAASGDALAQGAVDQAISALAAGLANTYVMLAPDLIVVGGGVAKAGAQLLDPLTAQIRERANLVSSAQIRVVPAELGYFAGAIGAALMGAEQFAL